MKRLFVATLSTLILMIVVTPGAKALRPELQPEGHSPIPSQSMAPTIPEEAKSTPDQPSDRPAMDKQQLSPQQQQQNEETTFEDLERAYIEKYGS